MTDEWGRLVSCTRCLHQSPTVLLPLCWDHWSLVLRHDQNVTDEWGWLVSCTRCLHQSPTVLLPLCWDHWSLVLRHDQNVTDEWGWLVSCTRCLLGPTALLPLCRAVCPAVAGSHAPA